MQDDKNRQQNISHIQEQFPTSNLSLLEETDLEDYCQNFDTFLINIILAYTGLKLESVKMQHLVPLLESIYRLCDQTFIGTWSFMQKLVVYSSSKSKIACNIFGTVVPGGKHSKVSLFLGDIDSNVKQECPEGDIIFMFDNKQVIGRTWNVCSEKS